MPSKEGSGSMKPAAVSVPGRDNRKHDRLTLDTEVKYKVVQRRRSEGARGDSGFRPDGRGINISLRGLAIDTGEPLKKGDYVKLELCLPGRPGPIRALAEVMWTVSVLGRYSSGIRFLILLDKANDSAIRWFIEQQRV